MTIQTGVIIGINFLLLLGWTARCRAQYPSGSDDQISFSIPMALGIGLILLLNIIGVMFAYAANKKGLRNSFGLGLLVVLLIGFGLCAGAKP